MIRFHATKRAAVISAAMLMGCIGNSARAYDWLQFDFSPDKTGNNTLETTVNASNVSQLKLLFDVALPSADNPDGPPVLLTGVSTSGGVKDLVFVQGTAGHITAFDAHTGAQVWTKAFASPHANNATAAIDPNGQFVYINTATQAHKLNVGDGSEVTGGGWPETTSVGSKTSCQLTIATAHDGNTYLYCANQGLASVTTINLGTGTQHVFNTAASDQPDTHSPTQMESGANPWSRGMAYDASLDRLFVGCGTNNGPNWIPGHVWRQSYLALAANGAARVDSTGGWPVDSYTPTNWAASVKSDQDICSGGLGILPVGLSSKYPHLGVNSGKDHNIRILNLADMSGQGGPGHTGGELFLYSFSAMSLMRAESCVWTNPADNQVWVFVSGNNGIAGFKVLIDGSGNPSLSLQWSDIPGGIHWTTSSFVANNILYAATGGGENTTTESTHAVNAMDPTTGKVLWSGAIDEFHWASPILANGIVYMADGNSGGFGGPGGHLRAWSLGTQPLPAADPTFSPPAGTYSTSQMVSITTATAGASIRYTTDGIMTPTETVGTIYSNTPVSIISSTNLKAIAYKSGLSDSNVVSGAYTISISQRAAAPVFSPGGGTYSSAQMVTITTATGGATIHYTTDGSTPSETNGTVYPPGTVIAIDSTTNLQAIASESGFADSNVTSATYTISIPQVVAPVFSPGGGAYLSAQMVTISSATSGATIHYTTDGSTPSETNGTAYPPGTVITIGSTTNLQAIAFEAGLADSTITSATYTIGTGQTFNFEAASMSPVGTGATVSTSSDSNVTGGLLEFLNATAAGQSMSLTTPSIPAGTYQVQFRYKTNTSRGQHNVVIDGSQVGGTIDQYATTSTYPTAILGTVTFATTGTHTIVLTVTGKDTAATKFYITADKFTLISQGGPSPAAAPEFSPPGGTYPGPIQVSITCPTPGAIIHYTTDGSTPSDTVGTVYNDILVPVNSTTTLEAIASAPGFADSVVASATYVIGTPQTFNFEAASMSPVGTGATVSTSSDSNVTGGLLEFLNATAAGQSMSLTTPSIPAGTYQVQFRYKTNTSRGQHNVVIDGSQVGGTIDQYATTSTYPTATLGTVTFATAGTHSIVLTVTGKDAAATHFYITADKFTFVGQ